MPKRLKADSPMVIGLMVGVALSVLAASGLAAMAMWVAATEKDRHRYEESICDDGYP